MKWFGPSWGAPVCEEEEHVQLAGPVTCPLCKKLVADDEQGVIVPHASGDGRYVLDAYHRLCIGALLGLNPRPDMLSTEPAPPSREAGEWTPPVERPLERVRRTDDGTYPNVGEELRKLDERAQAGTRGTRVGYGRGVVVTSERSFDPDLSPEHPYNQSVAEEKGLIYDGKHEVYRDMDGCQTHDKFGQKL